MAVDSYFSLHYRRYQVYSQIPKVPRVILTLPVNDTKHACFHTQALPTSVIFPALTLTEAMTFNSTFFLFDLKLIIHSQVHSQAIFGEAQPEFSHDAKYRARSLLSWPPVHTSKERRKLSCF